jgi:hypothetical protein
MGVKINQARRHVEPISFDDLIRACASIGASISTNGRDLAIFEGDIRHGAQAARRVNDMTADDSEIARHICAPSCNAIFGQSIAVRCLTAYIVANQPE